jgi:murein DD-endopeptidase MepM/ murein hydrolase activator NlpD
VLSPVNGVVVRVGEGWPDRERLSLVRDYLRGRFFPPRFSTSDYRPLAGNYVVIHSDSTYVFLAHLRCGSVRVEPNETVHIGQWIADVGNSGNSTAPHLHLQLMDAAELISANGIPCCFRSYERWNGLTWETTLNGIPEPGNPIRVVKP